MYAQSKQWGRRCSVGCESWPDDERFNVCPICGEETQRISNLLPLDMEEAEIKQREAIFENFYEVWCNDVAQPVDGPLEPTEDQHRKWDAIYPDGRPDGP